MKYSLTIAFFLAILSAFVFPVKSVAQEQEKPDIPTIASTEAERLERLLELEYWQVFYVDSTLQHDYAAMQKEMMELQASKVSNSSIYISVQDKWMDTIDRSYRRIFNDEQWAAYLKSGAGKQQKARAKRKAKMEAASLKEEKED